MTISEIFTLFQYDEWATERTLESVSNLSDGKYHDDLKSSHGGIHGTLRPHIQCEYDLASALEGKLPMSSSNAQEIPNLDSLKAHWKEYRISLHNYLRNLTEDILIAPLSYADLKGNKHAEPLYQQMQQVINHASYHRGQIVTMLRQLGGKPQATDLLLFYRTRQS